MFPISVRVSRFTRNLSTLNHLQNLSVWNLSRANINHVTYIINVHTCQTDSSPKKKTGNKPNLRNFGEKNRVKKAAFEKPFVALLPLTKV